MLDWLIQQIVAGSITTAAPLVMVLIMLFCKPTRVYAIATMFIYILFI